MTVTTAFAVIARLLTLLVLSWLLVAFAAGTVDPFLTDLAWLLAIGAVMAIPPSRRTVSRWITTGRLRRASA